MQMPEIQSPVDTNASLGELETGVIDFFVSGVRILGLPKSIGEIYGLLYISPDPLAFDDILSRLQISKGSTSQGLKFLRSLGAVKPIYMAGTRKDFYVAETELKKLVGGFIREELMPHLESGSERIRHLQGMVSDSDPEHGTFYTDRIEKLRIWQDRSRKVLPMLQKLLA